jgi:hypothetical protein
VNYQNSERFNHFSGVPIPDPKVIFGFPKEETHIDDFVQVEESQIETEEYSISGEISQ